MKKYKKSIRSSKPASLRATKTSTKEGILSLRNSGRAFVDCNREDLGIEIPFSFLGTGLHGDKVVVQTGSRAKNGRLKGKIIEVLERKRKHFFGRVEKKKKKLFFYADTNTRMPTFHVHSTNVDSLQDGDRVRASWYAWDDGHSPLVVIEEKCNELNSTEWMYRSLLSEKGFSVGFNDAIYEELKNCHISEDEKKSKHRKDYRSVLTFTIDPADAKDFDDAISFVELPEQTYEVGVHIADVTHYIEDGMLADVEAYRRSTSVYMPGYVEPMLPESISNDICSLVPNKDRLCFAVLMTMNNKGDVLKVEFAKTTIRSDQRFSYDEAQKILDKPEGIYAQPLKRLLAITKGLRDKRMRAGSINFSSKEVAIKLDENYKPLGVGTKKMGESNYLIEELMLLANRQVATYLDKRVPKVLFPLRVHGLPDAEKIKMFASFAQTMGYKVAQHPDQLPASLNNMVAKLKGESNPANRILETLAIRCMDKARYSTENIGHYGLHFQHYTHFTSPIRRYPDMLVHRILHACLKGEAKQVIKLDAKCRSCNERERAAMEVEREAQKYKLIEWIRPFIGDEFTAVITGVADHGVWAQITPHYTEGFISMQELEKTDSFDYVPHQFCLLGRKTKTKLVMGRQIKVRLIAASLVTRKVDLEWMV